MWQFLTSFNLVVNAKSDKFHDPLAIIQSSAAKYNYHNKYNKKKLRQAWQNLHAELNPDRGHYANQENPTK